MNGMRCSSDRRGSAALVAHCLLVALLVLVVAPMAATGPDRRPGAPAAAAAPAAHAGGGEASLRMPDMGTIELMGVNGRTLLFVGLLVCVLGLVFGLVIFGRVKRLPVHASMAEISELIYETCKTYLVTQGKLLLVLEAFIAVIIVLYFGILLHFEPIRVAIILLFSVIGIAGSYGVAWFGMRINTLANSRTAFASLQGRPFPVSSIPLESGMSIGMLLISVELFLMLCILLFIPGEFAGPCFIGFAIGESLGAAALRIAGGIFTKIADIGSDLMKIVFNIKEDDARNPGVIADCTGDNAGDSVGPDRGRLRDLRRHGRRPDLVHPARGEGSDGAGPAPGLDLHDARPDDRGERRVVPAQRRHDAQPLCRGQPHELRDAADLAGVADVRRVGPLTYVASYLLIPELGDGTLWWKLSTVITCGTLAGAVIPELVKVFTSTESGHVREVVTASREGGASLNILSGFIAGNFSAYWIGMAMIVLMGVAYLVSTTGLGSLMVAPAVFAFGLVAFGFLGMGPVTIAVDSYGPVTDNAQSVYELSVIEQIPGIKQQIRQQYGFDVDFEKAKALLEENDGAGNTFKATAKPVLIGTAVVGATTMIFSIIVLLTHGLTENLDKLSMLHPPFLLGMIAGGAMIYWFTGAATQAVSTGAYRAVEFIKANIRLEGATKASVADSKRVVEICTQYAQKGMFNIFVTVFFATLAFAFLEPYFFIGYLISIALFGLFQAIFMANAGGAWDNAKKIVETELKEKGTPLHAATVVGDTVGDPFKDTSSVALNPVIKFTTLFGLLAVELAVTLTAERGAGISLALAALFFAVSVVFVWRSFYRMRIEAVAR